MAKKTVNVALIGAQFRGKAHSNAWRKVGMFFDLPVKPKSRVGQTIARLADSQRITRFVRWCASGTLHPNLHPLAEADRCAEWILEWLKKKN